MELSDFLVNWKREIVADRYQAQRTSERESSTDASKSTAGEDDHQIAGTKRCEEAEHDEVCKLMRRTLPGDDCSALFVLPGSERVREQDTSVQWVLCRPPAGGHSDVNDDKKQQNNEEPLSCRTDCLVDALISDLVRRECIIGQYQ